MLGRHYEVLVTIIGLFLYRLVIALRPCTVVSAEGIRRPWGRPRFLTWAEVTSIARPEPLGRAVRLNLIGGKAVSLIDVPADQSAKVAAIGGKEVAAAPSPPKPPPPPRPPTEEVRHAEMTRQAADLSAGGRRLAEESGRIRRPRR